MSSLPVGFFMKLVVCTIYHEIYHVRETRDINYIGYTVIQY